MILLPRTVTTLQVITWLKFFSLTGGVMTGYLSLKKIDKY